MERTEAWLQNSSMRANAFLVRGDDARNPNGQFAFKGGGGAVTGMALKHSLLSTPDVHAGINKLYSKATMSFAGANQYEHYFTVDKNGKPREIQSGHAANADAVTVYAGDQMIIHTHPSAKSPSPSPDDVHAAKDAGIPNYELSQHALWVANPDGTAEKVANISVKKGVVQIEWIKSEGAVDAGTSAPAAQ